MTKRAPRSKDQAANLRVDADAEHNADLERSAAMLAGHSLRVVESMAKELNAGPRVVAAMIGNIAEAHNRAALRLTREALRRRLTAEGGAP